MKSSVSSHHPVKFYAKNLYDKFQQYEIIHLSNSTGKFAFLFSLAFLLYAVILEDSCLLMK